MKIYKPILVALMIAIAGVFASFSFAESQPDNLKVYTCGKYRIEATRIVDGFHFKITDGDRVRTVFYNDPNARGGSYEDHAVLLTECYGDSVAIRDTYSSRYHRNYIIHLINPNNDPLQIRLLGERTIELYRPSQPVESTEPVQATALMDDLLSKETDPWPVIKSELVSKKQIPNQEKDILNDRSFYVFDDNGGIETRTADSNWNTTIAKNRTSAMVCDNVAYVLYEKRFASDNTATSTFPAIQYIIERSGDGPRKLIPVPYVDGYWNEARFTFYPWFNRCFGKNVIFHTNDRLTLISKDTNFTDYFNPKISIKADSTVKWDFFNGQYYNPGKIEFTDKGVEGSSIVSILKQDGSTRDRSPVYFRNIREYPLNTTMEFRIDPVAHDKIIVVVKQPCDDCDNYSKTSYFLETDGVYEQITREEIQWDWNEVDKTFSLRATPIYISAEKGAIALRGQTLDEPMFLHGFPKDMEYELNWYRIGPLEFNGTRKIWYSFTVDGKTQTWEARVQ
ncbi:MAG: hypothetical protein ABII13_04400 [Patescibacteria group bacterium]|nr:hypothetical protein [Patescibacteria group bacterium]